MPAGARRWSRRQKGWLPRQRNSSLLASARQLQALVILRGFIPQVQQTPSCRPRVSCRPATRASRLSLLAPFQAEEALHREKEGEEPRDAEAEEGPDEDERVGPVNRAGDASRRHQMDDRHAQRG